VYSFFKEADGGVRTLNFFRANSSYCVKSAWFLGIMPATQAGGFTSSARGQSSTPVFAFDFAAEGADNIPREHLSDCCLGASPCPSEDIFPRMPSL
jgi:hypothetical protein